jgi:uncharacterized membrane protein YadS
MHHHFADGFWTPAEQWQSGITFSAKQLLEVAVTLRSEKGFRVPMPPL